MNDPKDNTDASGMPTHTTGEATAPSEGAGNEWLRKLNQQRDEWQVTATQLLERAEQAESENARLKRLVEAQKKVIRANYLSHTCKGDGDMTCRICAAEEELRQLYLEKGTP